MLSFCRRNINKMQLNVKMVFLVLLLVIVHKGKGLSTSEEGNSKKQFVLVHGACLGAFVWYKLIPLLRSSGHNVTALDLAASGIDERQVTDLRSMSDYFQPLTDFMASLPLQQRVILVGHSYGGLAISHAMQAFPKKISAAVFVGAVMPGPANVTLFFQKFFSTETPERDTQFYYGNGPNKPPTALKFGPNVVLTKIYQLSPLQDWTLAMTLMRPVPLFSIADMSKEFVLTREKYGSVKRIFIIGEKDLSFAKDFLEYMIQQNPPNQIQQILGSDHMVMISKPKVLWARLMSIAKDDH